MTAKQTASMLLRRPVTRTPSSRRTSALIYVRQSRHKEGERTVSPEVQEQHCRALPAVASCDDIEVFKDLDLSGGKLKGRKGFLALVARIKAGGVHVVAAYDQSRAFRNTSDALDFYSLMEKRSDIAVDFVHGRFDRSPAGEFTYTTLAAAHAMERRMTGEKIRDAYRYATQRGQMVGQVPGGYIRNPDGTILIDEDVAPTIRRIFEMYASGRFTARDIARRFNAENVPKLPRSRGAAWHWHSIAEILRNVAYAGMAFSESRRRGGHGDLIPASWSAIVSESTWKAARAISERRYGQGGRRAARGRLGYAFAGLLRCSCGERLHGAGKTRRNRLYYACRHGQEKLVACKERWVREDELMPWARTLLVELEALRPADFARRVDLLTSSAPADPRGAIESIDRSLERLDQLFLWGHWDEPKYRAERERLEGMRKELQDAEGPETIEPKLTAS
ncbi:MAG TPA: recombinase family protein [Candidatus Udaeobacter sp.]|nr:recombinase family protein [Candidatus Udaeobacter sp.]